MFTCCLKPQNPQHQILIMATAHCNKSSSFISVILVNFIAEEKEVTIVWGYNIKSITPLEDTPPPGLAEAVDSIFRKQQVRNR